MKLNRVFIIFLLLIPVIFFGQDAGQEVTFHQGENAFEDWFMDVFARIDMQVWDEANVVARLGRAIGAIGAIIYISYLGFQMQEGARPWEMTPLIRPIIVALILSNWASFCQLIQFPFEQAANPGIAKFNQMQGEAEDRRVARYEKQQQLVDKVIEMKAEEDAKAQEAEAQGGQGGIRAQISEMFDMGDLADLFKPINEWQLRFNFEMQRFVAELIDSLGLAIMRICTYFIFVLQKIWGYILVTLGPIAIGISLIPGFENSLSAWIAKFININLYSFIAYQIINIGQLLIMGAYDMEIERLDVVLGADLAEMTHFVDGQGFISLVLFTLVAYLITGVLMLMVPTLADSIVSAGGAGIMSKAKSGGRSLSSAAGASAATVLTAGKAAPAAYAKTLGQSVSQRAGIK